MTRGTRRRRIDVEKLDGLPGLHHWNILQYVDRIWCVAVLVKVNRNWEATIGYFVRVNPMSRITTPRTIFKLHFLHMRGGDYVAVVMDPSVVNIDCYYIYASHVRILGLDGFRTGVMTVGPHTKVYHKGYSTPRLLKLRGDVVVKTR